MEGLKPWDAWEKHPGMWRRIGLRDGRKAPSSKALGMWERKALHYVGGKPPSNKKKAVGVKEECPGDVGQQSDGV